MEKHFSNGRTMNKLGGTIQGKKKKKRLQGGKEIEYALKKKEYA